MQELSTSYSPLYEGEDDINSEADIGWRLTRMAGEEVVSPEEIIDPLMRYLIFMMCLPFILLGGMWVIGKAAERLGI